MTNQFCYSLTKGAALQTFKSISSTAQEKLGEFLAVFCREYAYGYSKTTFPETRLQLTNQKLVDFLEELQRLAKGAFEIAPHAIIEQFVYAKMPPLLKNSINQAHLEKAHENRLSHSKNEIKT